MSMQKVPITKTVKVNIVWMPAALLLSGIGVFTGCAAGSAVPVPTSTPAPSRQYEPNYRDALGEGRQWTKFALRYRVNLVAGQDSDARFQTALASWQPYFSEFFTFTPATGSDFDIEVESVPADSLGGDTIGSTTVTFQRSNRKIVKAKILVDGGLSDELLSQVLAHELGHAFGLDGHSPEVSDVMFARAHLPLAITERDRNTLFAVYADKLTASGRAEPQTSRNSDLVTTMVCEFHRDARR